MEPRLDRGPPKFYSDGGWWTRPRGGDPLTPLRISGSARSPGSARSSLDLRSSMSLQPATVLSATSYFHPPDNTPTGSYPTQNDGEGGTKGVEDDPEKVVSSEGEFPDGGLRAWAVVLGVSLRFTRWTVLTSP